MKGILESVHALQSRLTDAGIESIIIGGLAVAVWGEPRLTRDADLKVKVERDSASKLLSVLEGDYTFLSENPSAALEQAGMIFINDASGCRLDLLLVETSFDVEAIRRGKNIEILPGLSAVVCSAEDLIIYKLISTRPRDYEDVRGIVRRHGRDLDLKYLREWLRTFEEALDDSSLIQNFEALIG